MIIPFSEISSFQRPQQVVLTNGCFDILHIGHLRYLQAARALGAFLWVGVNSDRSVRALKGPERPLNNQDHRAELLAGLRCVDAVTIFDEATADALIEAIMPQKYAKAGDYSLDNLPEAPTLLRLHIEAVFLPFVAGQSSTRLISQLS